MDEKRILDRLDRIEAKIDDSNEHLASIDVILARATDSIEFHVKRTNDLQDVVNRVDRQVAVINGVFKLVLASGVAGTLILKLTGKL